MKKAGALYTYLKDNILEDHWEQVVATAHPNSYSSIIDLRKLPENLPHTTEKHFKVALTAEQRRHINELIDADPESLNQKHHENFDAFAEPSPLFAPSDLILSHIDDSELHTYARSKGAMTWDERIAKEQAEKKERTKLLDYLTLLFGDGFSLSEEQMRDTVSAGGSPVEMLEAAQPLHHITITDAQRAHVITLIGERPAALNEEYIGTANHINAFDDSYTAGDIILNCIEDDLLKQHARSKGALNYQERQARRSIDEGVEFWANCLRSYALADPAINDMKALGIIVTKPAYGKEKDVFFQQNFAQTSTSPDEDWQRYSRYMTADKYTQFNTDAMERFRTQIQEMLANDPLKQNKKMIAQAFHKQGIKFIFDKTTELS